jgi:phytanoyl-CoA hydroxylase
MGVLSQIKQKALTVKEQLFPQTEFDAATLPWIDREDANVDDFVKKYQPPFKVSYNLAEKLKFWQKNGYVILEQAIQSEMLDLFWADVEELVEHPEKYKMWARIDLPKFDPVRERHIKDFSTEDLKNKYVKLNDIHNLSVAGKKLMTHPAIVTFSGRYFSAKNGRDAKLGIYVRKSATHAPRLPLGNCQNAQSLSRCLDSSRRHKN